MDAGEGINDPQLQFTDCLNYCTQGNLYLVTKFLNTPFNSGEVFQSQQACKAELEKRKQEENPVPGTPGNPNSPQECDFTENFSLSQCKVTEDTPKVALTLKNIPVKEEDEGNSSISKYFYCLKTDPKNCNEGDMKPAEELSTRNGTTMTIRFPELCGDGENKLKTKCSILGGAYWFHRGKVYRVTIFSDKKKESSYIVTDGSFYIFHAYPEIKAPTPGPRPDLNINELTKKGANSKIQVTLKRGKQTGQNKDRSYWVQLIGRDTDYNSPSTCIKVPPNAEKSGDINLPREIIENKRVVGKLSEGNYVLAIKSTRGDCNQGDFTYWEIPVFIAVGYRNPDTKTDPIPGFIGKAVDDPYDQENAKYMNETNPPPICADNQKDANGYCTSIPTALGISIHTQPAVFVRDVFRIILTIGGIAMLAFFIRAGYTIMTSAGNKEKVGQAREQITSAVTGLIFIILSIAILEFIGINILQIPGLTR